jgi:hydrogenase assembly chaperone HypC/HupF
MCLGIPAQITDVETGHADVVMAKMAGVTRSVNVGVLDEPRPLAVGDWVLVHMGFALCLISEQEADEALAALGDERDAVSGLTGQALP